MYDNLGSHAGVQRPPLNPQQNPFGSAFYGAGSGSFEVAWVHMERNSWVQALNSCKAMYKLCPSFNTLFRTFITYKQIFSNPQYYFQVNDQYVRNKLKVVLFPFLHRGHWTRITEPVGGRLSYKPPIYDINVPDLYTPLMAFGTYVILAGFSFGLLGKFSPEALNLQFTRGLVGWFVQVALLRGMLYSLRDGEAPLLDIVAYGG